MSGSQESSDTGVARMRELSDDWAETFRLLGDPTRLRLLTVLHYEGPGTLSMSELAERAGVRTATASAALRLLTAAGIVTATRDGRMMRYALTDERVHRLLHHLGGTHAHHTHAHHTHEED
ncbi:ArsR/SmtB family transcription factor [Corynebacterium sp. AOP40-9SA-29]|uniref:ArsR/SmtB family transcription factor n=1 Tax=Corynebacterium sp. AOP40-9SA-29 TaxID=3457677 RepID=UPI0040343F4F